METLAGVMVKVYGSPAVIVMRAVSVIVLPMAAASIVATPASVLEVAVAVAAPPEVVVPERKASISVSLPPGAVFTVTVILREAKLKPVVMTFSIQASGPDMSRTLVYEGLSIVTVTSPLAGPWW
jgi:hypothetical protein